MAATTIFLLLVLMVALDMLVTFKLYRTVQDECHDTMKHMKRAIDAMQREIATYRLCIDSKIEKATFNAHPKRRRRKLNVEVKEEKKEECKNQEKKS